MNIAWQIYAKHKTAGAGAGAGHFSGALRHASVGVGLPVHPAHGTEDFWAGTGDGTFRGRFLVS